MPPFAKNDDWEEDDYEEDDLTDYSKTSKTAILICLDASANMQRPTPADGDDQDGDTVPGPSFFHRALESVFELEKRKALLSPSDLVGILIYNTTKLPEHESEEASGMYTLAKLSTVSIDQVKELKEIVDGAKADPSSLSSALPPSDEAVSTTTLLDRIISEFKESGVKDGGRRVFLITDDDDPCARMDKTKNVAQVTKSTKVKMKDLSQLGATVVPFFLGRPDKPFDTTKFWDTILSYVTVKTGADEGDAAEVEPIRARDGLVAFDDLLESMRTKTTAKRALWSVPLMLTDDLVIGVKGYGLLSEAKKPTPKYYYTGGMEAEAAETTTGWFDADDEAKFPSAFDPAQLRLAFDFSGIGGAEPAPPRWENGTDDTGGEGDSHAPPAVTAMDIDEEATQDEIIDIKKLDEDEQKDVKPVLGKRAYPPEEQTVGPEGSKKPKITFTRAELSKLRGLGLQPGIKVVGFQDSSTLKFDHNIKHSYFIYPDEETYIGSTRTFTALLRGLLNKNKIGITRCVYRRGSSPLICAMVPQEETFTEEGAQDKPPGFHMIPFPFMDDMREPPAKVKGEEQATLEADEQHVQLMTKLISKLQGGRYLPEQFPNPVLARHYAHLEALAFDEPWDESIAAEVDDNTTPLHESMHQRAGSHMLRWKESISADPIANSYVLKAAPKKRATSPDSKAKAQVSTDIDVEVVKDKYKDGTLHKLTVPVLKSFLRSVSRVPAQTLKANLLDAVETYFREEEA